MMKESRGQLGSIPIESIQWDSSWPELESPDKREEILLSVVKRFGIPMEAFEDYLLFKRSKGWWLMRKSPHLVEAAKLKIECAGIRAFHKVGRYIKPTTRLIQYFGKLATKALIELTKDEFARLASGQDIEMKVDLDDGYVILCLEGRVILGLGLWYKGKLVPQIPRKELRPAVLDPLLSR